MNYPAKESAQGLASLGRYGDTMLVHMNPKEVAGLQSLAMSKGGTLTVNPDTGMPEAFLGQLFEFAAPIAGGFFGLNPWLMAGIMGGKSLIEGDDPLEAAMSAFGGYSGAKLGSGLKDFSAPLKVPTAQTNSIANAGQFVDDINPSNLMNVGPKVADTTPFNKIAQTGYTGPAAPNFNVQPKLPTPPAAGIQGNINIADARPVGVQNIGAPEFTKPQQISIPDATEPVTLTGGVSKALEDPVGFARHIGEGDALMGAGKIGMYGASPFMEGMLEAPEFSMNRSEAERYDPNRRLNLSNDTGLRLLPNLNLSKTAKEGGMISSYALGGAIDVNPPEGGGISDLYNRPEGQRSMPLSSNGYGIGRLNNLAGEQSMTQAQTLGYAMGGLTALKQGGPSGGYLNGAGDGMSDSIPATIEGKQPARLADGEFVVPADVVSHLGNGSSKAGSKRLYAMLDKVRHARTGNKKQGKQIKAEKYLPA
jgi:hypothetical protein